jgi:hypothetical protein
MPNLAANLQLRVKEALEIAEMAELALIDVPRGTPTRELLTTIRVEALYEMAFLRIFVNWEAFLEQVFFRYLCGYRSIHGTASIVSGQGFRGSLAQAERDVLGGRQYILWHNPYHIITRSRTFFSACPVESTVSSNLARLEHLASIRNRIAHSQADARNKFDLATMAEAGRRYRASRAGAFLRDVDPAATPRSRWIQSFANDIIGMSAQIA